MEAPKMIRIVRTVTTVTDVDLTSYFDVVLGEFITSEGKTVHSHKRQWTAEEAIAFERSRGQSDQQEAFELAMQNDEYDGCRLSFDIVTLTPSRDVDLADAQRSTIDRIKAGQRPAGLSDAEWEWVREHPVEAVTR
jgi:hypothetical protein